MFGKRKKERDVIFSWRPSFKTTIRIHYFNRPDTVADEFEIIHHEIEDGFLKTVLPSGNDRCINVSNIRYYYVIREAIQYDDTNE